MWHSWILVFIVYRILSIECVQINFHFTDAPCYDHHPSRHHCLEVSAKTSRPETFRDTISYCLTECPYPWAFNATYSSYPSFTFQQLEQQNITSQQLYSWSASIDLIENYQHYLDRRDHHVDDIDHDVFYNCTWPRFGPSCQYTFDHLHSSLSNSYLSLKMLVNDYYFENSDIRTMVTCYEHLKCDRIISSSCLDWSEICNGVMDCLDGGQDEENCWQIEINECEDDEYRCMNGQCIHRRFYADQSHLIECIDASDELYHSHLATLFCYHYQPIVICEDIASQLYHSYPGLVSESVWDGHKRYTSIKALFSVRPIDLSDDCWQALVCRVSSAFSAISLCDAYCFYQECTILIEQHCPRNQSLYLLPNLPILFGHLYFLFTTQQLTSRSQRILPDFICLDSRFCSFIPFDNTTFRFHHLTCYSTGSIPIFPSQAYLQIAYRHYFQCAALPDHYYHFCNNDQLYPNLYQCMNTSKCISRHRFLDRVRDCFYGDDEQMGIVEQLVDLVNDPAFFRCASSNTFISYRLVNNGDCDCPYNDYRICDDEYSHERYVQTHISFQTICDGFTELKPLLIDARWITDETDCHYWLCDNVYTRCDGIWNCLDGKDEIGCHSSSLLSDQCPSNFRSCVLPETNELVCLSIDKVNDGHVDCLGATDEPLLCRINQTVVVSAKDYFYCIAEDMRRVCLMIYELCSSNTKPYCKHGDDRQFCRKDEIGEPIKFGCGVQSYPYRTSIEQYFCDRFGKGNKLTIVHFSMTDKISSPYESQSHETNLLLPSPEPTQVDVSYDNRCHRGLNLRVWLHSSSTSFNDTNTTSIACLCPPSYYGRYCQYQNQRVSLTLQFRVFSDALQTTFIIISLLIDHTYQRSIHSAQQMTYLPFRDCQIKFNFNLLFSTRPSNPSLNYSIHFDIYEQHSHHHRASYRVPILFSFLPVYRIALQLSIPRLSRQPSCTDLDCGKHGRCLRYTRVFHASSTTSFCQCDQGWSGLLCTIPISCSCSSEARCLGILAQSNRSICLCPPTKFGPRCFLTNIHICKNDASQPKCLNGGQCIPTNDYDRQPYQSYTCLCPKGFTGDRCEQQQTQIIIAFDPNLIDDLLQSMLIHFIRFYPTRRHENSSIARHIPFNYAPVSIVWSHPFQLVFVELDRHQYYLAFIRPVFNQSEVKMETMIRSSDRCPHIRELLSLALLQSHLLFRIKHYHLLCQSNNTIQQVSCFYDDDHFCLCQSSPRNLQGREANCLEYDHNQKFDCFGQNACENGGQCFQDSPTCPKISVCICAACSYGRRCQFTMNGFRLSLDAILGYHIQPHISFREQSSFVHLASALTLILTITGILNGILSLITFKNKKLCEMRCGCYLLGSSVTTLLTMTLFLLKFVTLLLSQMGMLTNQSVLAFQCRSVDYLLRICLNMDQWLNALVSMDRALTVIKGVSFDKIKNKRQAKYTIICLVLFVISSTIYDPIHRYLINDSMNNSDEDDRIWCVVSYSKLLQTFDTIIQMFHFCVAFLINLISTIIIIWQTARSRQMVRERIEFRVLLVEQLREHQQILIGPILIMVLSVPRLILGIVSGCMKSNRQSRMYLIGYFVQFAPACLNFVIFVLPSTLYRREFLQTMRRYRHRMRLLFCTVK